MSTSEIDVKLHEAYQCYQAMFEQASVGIARTAVDGRFLDVNRKLCSILGYSRDELLRLTFRTITHPEDLDTSLAYIAQILRGELYDHGIEKRYICKDGSIVWGYLTVSLVRTVTGEPDYFISAIQDIQEFKLMETALREQEQRARSVIEASIDGFWVVSCLDGSIVEVNDVYCRLSKYSRAELLTMRVTDLDCNESPIESVVHIKKVVEQGGDVFTTQHRCKDGEIWPVEVTVTYSKLEGGLFFVFLRDIRERYISRALLNLRIRLSDLVRTDSTQVLSKVALDQAEILTHSQIGFFHLVDADQQSISLQVWSTNTTKTFCAATMQEHYPISEAGVWVDCIHQRCPVIHNDYAMLSHKKGLPVGHPQVIRELTVPISRNGLIVAVIGVGNKLAAYTDADIQVVQQIGELTFDYIEHKMVDDRVEFMAYYDALTRLPNRTLLLDRINQGIAQTKRSGNILVLAYLDLDGFKPVNDRYGHDIGDQFLRSFAQRMTATLRAGDTLARLGGDEFAVVLPGIIQAHDGEVILWRMLEILSEPFCIASHEIHVGASIGFTLYPLDNSGPEGLLHHADQAMYQAKWQGKNTVRLYDVAQNVRLVIQQETVAEMRQALAKNELMLYYQPQIKLTTGELIGVEANLRWLHPQRGLLLANEFVPTLDGTPKAVRIDEWVIRQALTQIAAWDEQGTPMSTSVNISYNSLCTENFLNFMRAQADHWPKKILSKLEIELALLVATVDLSILKATLSGCVELGVRFTLDDCGANYAYLSHIRQLRIHKLKLAPHFVSSAKESADNLKTLEKALEFAIECQLPVVAQGVDSVDIAALLIDLGCPFAQGNYIAQPMDAESLLDWQRAWPLDHRCRNLRTLDPLNTHNALLQVAVNNVLRWSDDVTQFIKTGGQAPCPMLCTDQCRLNDWYNTLGLFRYGTRPGFAFQSARHRAMHTLAAELVELVENGLSEMAKVRLLQFYEQRDEIIAMLRRLVE